MFDLRLGNFIRAFSGSNDDDASAHSIERRLRGPGVVGNDPFSPVQ